MPPGPVPPPPDTRTPQDDPASAGAPADPGVPGAGEAEARAGEARADEAGLAPGIAPATGPGSELLWEPNPDSVADEPGGTASPVPGPRRRTLPMVVGGLLVAVLALIMLARTGDQAGPTQRRMAAWPTAPAASPTTPAGVRDWQWTPPPGPTEISATPPGAMPGPMPPAGSGSEVARPTSDPRSPDGDRRPGPPAAASAFCAAAGSGLTGLGRKGLEALTSMASRAGDLTPQSRELVRTAVDDAARLEAAAPAELGAALQTLATAWSRLSAELERAGYDRTAIVGLALKYLATPGVALAVDALGRWTANNCGVDLIDGQAVAG
jgi:hypothetical protein